MAKGEGSFDTTVAGRPMMRKLGRSSPDWPARASRKRPGRDPGAPARPCPKKLGVRPIFERVEIGGDDSSFVSGRGGLRLVMTEGWLVER